MTVSIREYLSVELIVSNCLGMTNLGWAVNADFWMFDCQQYLVATGHMQLILRELEENRKNLCALLAAHNTSLPCVNLAYGYSTADTSIFLRFEIFVCCSHLLALVGLSTLMVCWWLRNTAISHCFVRFLTVLWLSHIASILVDSCINGQSNTSCPSIAHWLCFWLYFLNTVHLTSSVQYASILRWNLQ